MLPKGSMIEATMKPPKSRSGSYGLAPIAIFLTGLFAGMLAATAQDACPNRGQLDTQYCDRDGDLVADVPTDAAKQKDPSTLVWAYTPVEDPAVYANRPWRQRFLDRIAFGLTRVLIFLHGKRY